MAEGAVVLLEGWIPEDQEADVKKLLDDSGVYYEIRKATKEDNAPIKLKNNAFVRMYEVLTKMYGMPDYAEFDPTLSWLRSSHCSLHSVWVMPVTDWC